MNIVLTCYLTTRRDPQRNVVWPTDNDATVRRWINSLTALSLQGIIFHDNCGEEFRRCWSSPNLSFQKVQWKTPWTPAEERAQIYKDWIEANPHDKILTTDLSDVEFYHDPFPLLTDPSVIYVGIEPNVTGNIQWMLNRMRETYGEVTDTEKLILNPGILGGFRAPLLDFLTRWLEEMGRAIKPTLPPHDIVAFNRLIYREHVPFITGFPLHTEFRKNEGPQSGCYIRHK